ncbi:MAG: hypothetical protein OXI46_02455 [Gemmatimonadota bacterium]|nr:hypothetical protein [Gemmatimonadota bacterium]
MGCFPGVRRSVQFSLREGVVILVSIALAGCGGGEIIRLPPSRPIVVSSGERIRVDPARMDTIYAWLLEENDNIELDPTFLIAAVPAARESLPWQTIDIVGDTARFQYDRANPDVTTAFNIYAHLHLMQRMGRLEEWLPEHVDAEGYVLERAIVNRMADVWLLGRSMFDAPAYRLLDEVMYAREAGFLDAYMLVARGDEFAEERERWEQENPVRLDEYREWYARVFEGDPPGLSSEASER